MRSLLWLPCDRSPQTQWFKQHERVPQLLQVGSPGAPGLGSVSQSRSQGAGGPGPVLGALGENPLPHSFKLSAELGSEMPVSLLAVSRGPFCPAFLAVGPAPVEAFPRIDSLAPRSELLL